MKISEMGQSAERVSDMMRVLANPNRLMILCLLVEGEKPVGELARRLEMRDASVSQQLALLRKDGLVRTRRDGQSILYSLARRDVVLLMEFLYGTYCTPSEGKESGNVTKVA